MLTWRLLAAALTAEAAVWALLAVIHRTVGEERLNAHAANVWIAGRQVVRNTQALHLLKTTQQRAAELVEELERQKSQIEQPGRKA